MSNNPIKFYHRDKDYYEFTNFAEGYPINFPSLPGYENLAGQWMTSEHLFQAATFRDRKEIVERFRNLTNAREAFDLKRKLIKEEKKNPTGGWNEWEGTGSGHWKGNGSKAKKIEVMRLVVKQKIFQHEYLKKLLLETGDKEIIEESPYDDCWGNTKGGKNWLGQILMEIRQEIKQEKGNPIPTNPETTTSTPNDNDPATSSPNSPNKPENENNEQPSPPKTPKNDERNDNPSPTNPQKEDSNSPSPTNHPSESPNNSPSPNSPPSSLNLESITQAESIQAAYQNTHQQITQLLRKSKLKSTDLDQKYHSWENQLASLTEIEKIIELAQQLEKEIQAKKAQKESNSQVKKPEIPKGKIVGGIILVSGGIVAFWLIIKRSKKLKKRTKN